jgi:hypothetical protein
MSRATSPSRSQPSRLVLLGGVCTAIENRNWTGPAESCRPDCLTQYSPPGFARIAANPPHRKGLRKVLALPRVRGICTSCEPVWLMHASMTCWHGPGQAHHTGYATMAPQSFLRP